MKWRASLAARRAIPGIGVGLLLWIAGVSHPTALSGQEPWPLDGRMVRAYLDCSDDICDADRILQEVGFVVWVREPTDADVHVLITSTVTEADAVAYELQFIGREVFESDDLDLRVTSPDWETDEERFQGYLEALKVGLTRYAAVSAALQGLSVSYALDEASPDPGVPGGDPWDRWVFQLDLSGTFEGQSSTRSNELEGAFRVNRITEASKFLFNLYGNREDDEFDFDDRTYSSSAETWGAGAVYAKSLGPRWGAGVRTEVYSSTYDNTEFLWVFGPAVEYNLFPYSESARHYFTFQYSVGWVDYNFFEETIFDQLEESYWEHRLLVDLEASRTWGSVGISALASQFLHNASKYKIEFGASADLRVHRGLSFFLDGSYEVVRDQITLPKADATDEEVFLRRKALETEFQAAIRLGVRIRFGSTLANIVNDRLDTRD